MSYDAPPPPPGEPTPEPPTTPEPYQPPAASVPPPPPPPPPPAPPGGYPPPPPGGGYPPPPGGPVDPNSVPPDGVQALTYGWRKVFANFGPIVVAVLGYVLALIIVIAVLEILVYGAIKPSGTFGRLVVGGLISGLIVVFYSVVQAGIARASLALTDGRQFTTADVFTTDNLGNVIVTGILIGIAVAIGSILCYLPGLIIQFLATFAIFFVVDKQLAPVDAIKASVKLVVDHIGVMIVFFILSGVALLIGFCVICVGLFVAIPVVIIGQAYLFRRLQNEPVAA